MGEEVEVKRCRDCGEVKLVTDFGIAFKHYRLPRCPACQRDFRREYQRNYRKKRLAKDPEYKERTTMHVRNSRQREKERKIEVAKIKLSLSGERS